MSKTAKAKSKQERLKQKRAKRNAMQALYQSYRDRGETKGSRRGRKKSAKKVNAVSTISHSGGKCGNVGCKKCNPRAINFDGFIVNGRPKGMPQWMWLIYKAA